MAILAAFGMHFSCASGENARYSETTYLEDRDIRIKVDIEGMVNSDFGRSGSFVTKRYNLVVTYPGREDVKITVFTDAAIPSQEEMRKGMARLGLRVSPDRRHFALDLRPFVSGIFFFHLLAAGPPVYIKEFGDDLGYRSLGDIDWRKVPATENIARTYLRKKIGKGEFCMDWNLERPLSLNTGMSHVAETILEAWPLCGDMRSIVEAMAGKTGSSAWKESLKKRIDALLVKQDLPVHAAAGIIDACRALEDVGRRDLAYGAAIRHWPHPDIHGAFMLHVEELPDAVKKNLVTKAKEMLVSGARQQYEKDYSREVLRKLH